MAEYAVPAVPPGKLEVVTVSTASTVRESAAVAVRPPLVTCTVKAEVPGVVGVPEMTPDAGARDSPAGSDPTLTAQV